jgi:hypothetical protein
MANYQKGESQMASVNIRSRIVGHGEEVPDQLLANPANWRIHPRAQQDAMAGVLEQIGWVQSVIVNRTTGHLVDGHMRVSLALREGVSSIPVAYVELTAEEEALVLATLDPLGSAAVTDKEKLAELLAEVSVDSKELEVFLSRFGDDGTGMTRDQRMNEWIGMPEFDQSDRTSKFEVVVHFLSESQRDAFAELVGQKITAKTHSIWYPEEDEVREAGVHRYASEGKE